MSGGHACVAWRMTYYYYESQECPERGALRARRVHRGIAAARVQRARVDGRGAEEPEDLRGRRALDSARTPTLACSPQRTHVTGTTDSTEPWGGGGVGGSKVWQTLRRQWDAECSDSGGIGGLSYYATGSARPPLTCSTVPLLSANKTAKIQARLGGEMSHPKQLPYNRHENKRGAVLACRTGGVRPPHNHARFAALACVRMRMP